MGSGQYQQTLEKVVDNSPASMLAASEHILFNKATGTLNKIKRLAEYVAEEKGKPVEDIYGMIGFNPALFLSQYANPTTHAEIPVRVPYGTAFTTLDTDPEKALAADEAYLAKKLIKIASEGTRGMIYAGGLRDFFGDADPEVAASNLDWIVNGELPQKNGRDIAPSEGLVSRIVNSGIVRRMAEMKALMNLYGCNPRALTLPGLMAVPMDQKKVYKETEKVNLRSRGHT